MFSLRLFCDCGFGDFRLLWFLLLFVGLGSWSSCYVLLVSVCLLFCGLVILILCLWRFIAWTYEYFPVLCLLWLWFVISLFDVWVYFAG